MNPKFRLLDFKICSTGESVSRYERVLLAASGSASGASRLLFQLRLSQDWHLRTTHYCLAETLRNLGKLPDPRLAGEIWETLLRPGLTIDADVWTSDKPLVFPVPKDRPVLFSALATSDWLLTLDRADFLKWLGRSVYHLHVDTPAGFLKAMRESGKL